MTKYASGTLWLSEIAFSANCMAESSAWMVNPMMGVSTPTEIPTEQAANMAEQADFDGPRGQQVMTLVDQAEHEEWVADKMQYKLAQELFALEDQLKPTDILLWSEIFKNLGALANHADKTAERLRRMLAR